MKASVLITSLQKLVEEFGDLEVTDEFGAPVYQAYYMYDDDEPITAVPVFAISTEI